MNQKTILEKARQILQNNEEFQDEIKWYKETFNKEPEIVEELIFPWNNGTVILSNEGCISLTDDYYNELLFDLDEQFEKAGILCEAYDGGTFILSSIN